MKAIIYTITSVLFLVQLTEGGAIHRRHVRNADNVDDSGQGHVNDDSPQLENVEYPEYGVINIPNGHQAVQSNGVTVQDNGPGNQSQRLIQDENADDNHKSNTLFTNGVGGQPVDNGEILGDNQPNLDASADRNANGELGESLERNLNSDILENGDAELGINNNDHIEDGEQSVHVDEQHADSVDAEHRQHVIQLDIEHAEQNTESIHNDEKDSANAIRPHVHASVTRSNNMSTTQEPRFGILTTATFHLHGRREVPEVEVNRRNSERQSLLLDASLRGSQTTRARVSQLNYSSDQSSMEQHQPFLLEPRDGAANQGSQISLDHEPSVQTNPDSIDSQGRQQGNKESQNVGSGPDAENNEPQHEQHGENEENNNQNTIPVIHTVTLSQGGIIPHEKEENANNEPEVVLSNQTYSSTTPVESPNEQNGNEGHAENLRPSSGQSGVDIPIDNRNYNQSITPETTDQGQSRHTLNHLTLHTSERINILPTPAIEREHEVEYSASTNTFRTSLSGEFNHESSGSGSDIGGEGSGSENQNTEVECDHNSDVDESESHETDNSEVESSGHENIIDVGSKQNKDSIKHTNCRGRSSTLQPVLGSVTQSFENMASLGISPRILLQPSVTAPEPLLTSELLFSILGMSTESTRRSIQREIDSSYQENLESDLSSAILSDTYDYETDYSPEILPSTTTADFFPSDYHKSSTSLYDSASRGSPIATWTVSDSFMYLTNSPRNTLTLSAENQPSDKTAISPTAASTYIYPSDNTLIVLDAESEIPFLTITSSTAPMFNSKANISATSPMLVSEVMTTSIHHLDSSTLSAFVKISGSTKVVPVSSLGTDTVSLKSRVPDESTTVSSNSALPSSFQYSSTTMARTNKGPSTHHTTAVLTTNRTTLRTLILPHSTKMKNPDSTTISNIHTTKKRVTFKDTEKPETYTSTTTTTRLIPPFTVSQPITILPAPGSLVNMTTRPTLAVFKTTKHSVMTTPPPVFLQIWIRMSSCEFYNQKPVFITELQRLIVSEKQVSIRDEQFVVRIKDLPEEYCKDVPSEITVNEETLDQITVEMYIIDNKGNIDIRLTYDVSSVIRKGFTDASSAFKDKIVRVDVQDSLFNTKPHPAESAESINDDASVSMVIVLGSVGGCCCVIMVILQVVLIHRRVTAKRKASYLSRRLSVRSMDHVALGVIPKSRPNSGYWNPALSDLDDIYDSKHSHLMNFSEMANFCMDVTAIHEEFQTIPCETPDSSVVPIGEEDKNRFANVLPYKHTRVKLKTKPGDMSDYINANFVTGYKRAQKAYIATQSPLVNTVEDFWRMVWEQQSRVILMLNPVMASRKPKHSTCYWPDDLQTDVRRLYGDFGIMLKKRDVHQDYIECTLELMNLETNLKRDVKHFWLTCWPESRSVEPLRFVKYILDSRPHYENSAAPAVVHCGPGQGRSGALIAVDMCMRRFEDKRRVDILDCVFKMRNERAGAVQNKEQYALIYQALNEYAVLLSSPSLSTRSSIITLHAML